MKNIDLKMNTITKGQFGTAVCKQCDSDGGEWYRIQNMKKCTVAVFTLVTALFLSGLFLDIHFLRTNKDWTNDFNSINKMYLQTHSADGRQTGPNIDARDHTINLRVTKNRAIIPIDTLKIVTQPISLACPRNSSSHPLHDETRKRYEIHDLFRVKTPALLPNYKNPCWKQDNPSKLVCLPYFYLVGFPKCGTTFTFSTIVGHPEAVMGKVKETQWIARKRFTARSRLQNYLNYFTPAARAIESKASIDPLTGQKFHPIITGDGSVSTAWHNPKWRYLPGNYNCTEPRVLNPHYIYHLNPSTKVIILVRNPTDRVISAYNFFTSYKITPESFNTTVVDDLRRFEDCCSKFSLRVCAYDVNIRLRCGLYHVFIIDWMKVFPADQILIARLEDIRRDPYRLFTRIFDFLGLSHLSRSDLEEILNKISMNDKEKRFQATNETRRLLDDFYRPHNIQLAQLLQQHDPNSYPNIHNAMYNH